MRHSSVHGPMRTNPAVLSSSRYTRMPRSPSITRYHGAGAGRREPMQSGQNQGPMCIHTTEEEAIGQLQLTCLGSSYREGVYPSELIQMPQGPPAHDLSSELEYVQESNQNFKAIPRFGCPRRTMVVLDKYSTGCACGVRGFRTFTFAIYRKHHA